MPQEARPVLHRLEQYLPPPQSPQLRTYLTHLKDRIHTPEAAPDTVTRIEQIIQRNNVMAEALQSPEYLDILEHEKKLRGKAKLGGIGCIDGRFDFIHPFGRTMNVWEEPASLIEVRGRDGMPNTVTSAPFTEALRAAAEDKRDLLEIVFAHTSLTTDHKCGRMMAGEKKGEFAHLPGELDTVEAKNLHLIETVQIPAITETYNVFRTHNQMEPLKQVAIPAMYDTDTMGVVLNFGSDHELSTTGLVREMQEDIDLIVARRFRGFGSMSNTFTNPAHFTEFSQRVLGVTTGLMKSDRFSARVSEHIHRYYPDLTQDQQQALMYVVTRTAASQYVTGLAKQVPPEGPTHPFAEHDEKYMTVSTDGKIMGGFDVGEQSFGSSPSDAEKAIEHILTKLSLLDSHHAHDKQRSPDVLFVSNVVDAALWNKHVNEDQDQTVKRTLGRNGDLYRTICSDEAIFRRIQDGSLIVVPVLLDQDSRKVLTVVDQSAYI